MSIDSVEMAQVFYESRNPGSRWHRLSWFEKVHMAVLAERAACIRLCEERTAHHGGSPDALGMALACAADIRERGEP